MLDPWAALPVDEEPPGILIVIQEKAKLISTSISTGKRINLIVRFIVLPPLADIPESR